MTEHQDSGLCLDYTPRCPFTKSTLSAKIINLRKASQENHVRRMKLAYQKKNMRGLVDCSSCLSPSFPRQRSPNKSSFVTPVSVQDGADNIQSRRKVNFDLLPAKVNSPVNRIKYPDSSKSNSEKKNNQNRISKAKNKHSSNFCEGGFRHLHSSNRNKSMNESNDTHVTKCQKEMKMSLSKDEKASPFLSKKMESTPNVEEPLLKVPPVTIKKKNDIGEGISKNNLVAKKKISKIPVLKSRLTAKDNAKENKRLVLDNSNEIVEEALESMLDDVENEIKDLNMNLEENPTMNVPSEADLEEADHQDPVYRNLPDYPTENKTKELNLQQTTEKEDGDADIKTAQTLPSLIYQCYEEDSCRDLYKTFCEEEKSRDEISLIDKWMNGILDDADSGKNSSESSPMSKFLKEKISLLTLRKNYIPETLDIKKGSGVSAKYDYINDRTESEISSEIFYGFEERCNEKSSPKLDNMDKWHNMNFEADSTITVPSDKDLEVEDYRDPAYRSLPDYPNTPYNLRYPRYKFKAQKDVFNSTETKSPNSANRAKSLKNRKKSYNATPKRLKSAKKKKIKKISPKKDVSF